MEMEQSDAMEISSEYGNCFTRARKSCLSGQSVKSLKQQKLPAWRPLLTEKYATTLFFGVALLFVPLGIVLTVLTESLVQHDVYYTHCLHTTTSQDCAEFVKDANNYLNYDTCPCEVTFRLTKAIEGDVTMFYGLHTFYQNHRLYVVARDDWQLYGQDVANPKSALCGDLTTAWDSLLNQTLPIAPCGAVANSMFNDTFRIYYLGENGTDTPEQVGLKRTGIAWSSDKNVRFKNPSGPGSLQSRFAGTTKPPNWKKYVYELDLTDDENNGFTNEDFIVWMKTEAISDFRKTYRLIEKNGSFVQGLPAGYYQMDVDYAFPVTSFEGRKFVSFSNQFWGGSRNPFLGILYCVVGSLSAIIGLLFCALHAKFGSTGRRRSVVLPADANLGDSFRHMAPPVQSDPARGHDNPTFMSN